VRRLNRSMLEFSYPEELSRLAQFRTNYYDYYHPHGFAGTTWRNFQALHRYGLLPIQTMAPQRNAAYKNTLSDLEYFKAMNDDVVLQMEVLARTMNAWLKNAQIRYEGTPKKNVPGTTVAEERANGPENLIKQALRIHLNCTDPDFEERVIRCAAALKTANNPSFEDYIAAHREGGSYVGHCYRTWGAPDSKECRHAAEEPQK
jgi:hypothetical protein